MTEYKLLRNAYLEISTLSANIFALYYRNVNSLLGVKIWKFSPVILKCTSLIDSVIQIILRSSWRNRPLKLHLTNTQVATGLSVPRNVQYVEYIAWITSLNTLFDKSERVKVFQNFNT